jgi:hypothetical protein
MEAHFSSIGISHTIFMMYKLSMVMKCLCSIMKLRLLHKVACRLNIHDEKMDLWCQMKRTWFQAQIKQDIAISTQFEHERHCTHKRGSYNIITKESHPKAYISQSYQEHSYTSHEQHKQSHNLISSLSWWTRHMRGAHLYGIWYNCSLW